MPTIKKATASKTIAKAVQPIVVKEEVTKRARAHISKALFVDMVAALKRAKGDAEKSFTLLKPAIGYQAGLARYRNAGMNIDKVREMLTEGLTAEQIVDKLYNRKAKSLKTGNKGAISLRELIVAECVKLVPSLVQQEVRSLLVA